MTKKYQIFTIPNILSVVRILIIPFVVWAIYLKQTYLASILIVVSAITDIVDGFIARKFNMISPLGKALDPIADKLTIGVILLSLCFDNPIIIYLLSIFIVKEILMGVEGLLIIKYTGTTYSAKWYGKASTIMLYLTILTIILWVNIPFAVLVVLLSFCISFVAFSFIMYTLMNIKNIKSAKNNSNNN